MTEHKIKSLLTLDEVLEATGGIYVGSDNNRKHFAFTSVATDSRNIVPSSLFVPLMGELQDGHKYCPQAVKNGCTVIFIYKSEYSKNSSYYDELTSNNDKISVIQVDNTLTALQKAAEKYVSKFPNLIKVAITGSSGKTTTKELVVGVLKQKFNVVYTKGNFNSETGLPLSVFNIREDHELGVFEMGMNRKDEILEISSVLKAKYALITNIGTAHIGLLGSQKNIAKEKRHVFDYIPGDGCAFVPALDEYADFCTEGVRGDIVKYGSFIPEEKSGVKFIEDLGINGTRFSIDGIEVHLHLAGVYNYTNALGAVAIGRKLGLNAAEIKAGIESVSPISGRMESENITLNNGKKITIIKDCYNANPDSVKNVLMFCASLKNVNNLIYVLGDMLELGEKSKESHEAVGNIVSSDKPSYAIFVGTEMKYAYDKARLRGYDTLEYLQDSDDNAMNVIASSILDRVEDNDVLLIKASRGISLERIIPLISQ